jgi:Cyclic nucleotide-binding domain/Bacterial PH domain
MENYQYLASYLRQVPFMRNLPAAYRQALAKICDLRYYEVGEVIIPQGSITDRFFVVAEGRVHFRRTDANQVWRAVGDAAPGQHFGVAMFTTQALSEYKASALTPSTLFVMERQAFDDLVGARPDILKAMGPIYRKRLEITRGFPWLTPGEEVVLTTHRHWFALVEGIAGPVLVALILTGLLAVVQIFGLVGLLNTYPLVVGIPMVLLLVWLAYGANDYANDDFIVTNKRVAHIERIILRKELRYQIPNDKIQTMTVRRVGALASALGISDLEIQSAGRADSRIVFDRVARAEAIRQNILDQKWNLRSHDEAEMRRRFRDRVERDLTPYIYKAAGEEEPQELPISRPRPSWSRYLAGTWRRMFGREFRDGSTITYRKHWVALVRQAGRWLFFFVVLSFLLIIYLAIPVLQILPTLPALAVFGFLFLVDLSGLGWEWEDWRNDIYQVTNSQIIDIERLPFGLRSRSTEALISNVQNARALRPHPINTLLNFGNVEVQTASGGPGLVFYDVGRPEGIVEELFRRIESHRLRMMEHQMHVLGQQVTDALVTYDHMKEKQSAMLAASSALSLTEGDAGADPALSSGAPAAGEQEQAEANEETIQLPGTTPTRKAIMQEFPFIEDDEESE